jgi:hypothetical protein
MTGTAVRRRAGQQFVVVRWHLALLARATTCFFFNYNFGGGRYVGPSPIITAD